MLPHLNNLFCEFTIFDFVEWVPDETDVPNYFHRKKIPFEMDLEEINTFLQSLF